jgi:hypothetical protein
MDLRNLTRDELAIREGQAITAICTTGFTNADMNHCAHFVSHALDLTIGTLCGSMGWATRGQGATIRVNEVFNYCTNRGAWDARDGTWNACLIFVTVNGNVTGDPPIMGDHPRKHIGLHMGGEVWHYSNGQDRVIRESVAEFQARFRSAYGANISFYHGYRNDI